MSKKLIQLRNIILVMLIVELIILVAIDIFFPSKYITLLLIYIFLKNAISVAIIYYLFNTIETENTSISNTIDQESRSIFMFGGIGLIKYDTTRTIIWTSDLFEELEIKIVGKKLLEWQPTLANLFEDIDIKIIDINNRKYEVYNNMEKRLLYLKDITEAQSLSNEVVEQQICIAYIGLDNYDECIDRADEQTVASIQSIGRQVILDWAGQNGIVLRRYKSDSYIAIFNEGIYNKQAELRFELLNTFKQKMKELNIVMTLSIGIGRDSKILRELDQMAFEALGLANSRGGDQVAVKSLNSNVRYFGGNSENIEKTSRVRSRVVASTLKTLIKQADEVLIMGHRQSDFDSLGASIGVRALCLSLNKDAKIVLDDQSLENKVMYIINDMKKEVEYKEIFVGVNTAREILTNDTLLIVVDNHKPSLAIDKVILNDATKIVVIDHHRRSEEFIDLPLLTYLEPSASSTVELITELYSYQKNEIKLSEQDATIMYTGMLIDTSNFKTRVGQRTFEMASILRSMGANVLEANRYLEDDYNTTFDKLSIVQNMYQISDGIIIAYGEKNKIYNRTILAKAGNELLAISKIKAVFTVGFVDKNQVAISARSSRDVNVQLIMENLGGGGHFSMAACQIESASLDEVRSLLENEIKIYEEEREVE